MKNLSLILLTMIIFLMTTTCCFAQADSAKTLVEQGIILNDAGNYPGAIEKYNDALKVNPNYARADYEMGYTMYVSGKGKEAIPYLEIVLKANQYIDESYDLIGSIYDDSNEPDKAIEYYQMGINANPNYERHHFNLGVTYLRKKNYPEAEASEIAAIKLDPKHASAQRMYAVASNSEGKRMHELLAWCNYLMLEPNSNRSAGALAFVRSILTYGIQDKGKNVNIGVSSADLDKGTLPIQMAVIEATQGKIGLTALDTLTLQLTEVFKMIPEIAESKNDTFFGNYYAKFFSALAASGNMAAFTRLISLSAYKDENLAWLKENKKQVDDLNIWIRSNPRSFGDK